MNYEKLPKELKNLDVFCLWKYQKDKSGRLTKPPFSAKLVDMHQLTSLVTLLALIRHMKR